MYRQYNDHSPVLGRGPRFPGSQSRLSGMAWGVSNAIHEPRSWACTSVGSECGSYLLSRSKKKKKYMLACCAAIIMQQRVRVGCTMQSGSIPGQTEAVRDLISGVTHPGPKGDKFKMAARLRRLLDPEENLKRTGRCRPSFARLSLDDQRGPLRSETLHFWQRERERHSTRY